MRTRSHVRSNVVISVLMLGVSMVIGFNRQLKADILYGATTAGQLLHIDTDTGMGTLIGNIGFGTIEAMEFLPDGRLVGIANANQLIEIDRLTGVGQLIGTVFGYGWVEGLAYNSATNQLYAAATTSSAANSNRLIAIDPLTGAAIWSAPSAFGSSFWDVDGLAYSPVHGLLGSHINTNPSLFGIHTTTGLGSALGPLSSAIVGMDFAADGTLYGATIPNIFSGGPSRLVRINPVTGAIQDIGPIGFDTIQAIAFVTVPEPSGIVLLGMAGLLGLALRRRRNSSLSGPFSSCN